MAKLTRKHYRMYADWVVEYIMCSPYPSRQQAWKKIHTIPSCGKSLRLDKAMLEYVLHQARKCPGKTIPAEVQWAVRNYLYCSNENFIKSTFDDYIAAKLPAKLKES